VAVNDRGPTVVTPDMRTSRLVIAALAAIAIVVVIAPASSAGGSVWRFDREGYRPGEPVVARASVGWAHGNLGTPEEGPYRAYLLPEGEPVEVPEGTTSPFIPRSALPVGEIEVVLGPISLAPDGVSGPKFGPNGAIVRFTLPDLAPGRYQLLHCNDPCTTPLGDITWGVLTVIEPDGSVPAPPPTTAIPMPATTAAPTPATSAATSTTSTAAATGTTAPPTTLEPKAIAASGRGAAPRSPAPAVVVALLVVAVLAGGGAMVRRRHGARAVVAGSAPVVPPSP
jgi:microcystin-dependent protein